MFVFQLSITIIFILCLFLFYFLNEIVSIFYENTFFSELFIFIFIFIVFFSLNYLFWEDKIKDGVDSELENFEETNIDIFYKFVLLFEKNLSSLFNFLIIELKKMFIYFFKFKFFFSINNVKNFYKLKISNKIILWRPIFKKWSYLGYYRSNRSKWIK